MQHSQQPQVGVIFTITDALQRRKLRVWFSRKPKMTLYRWQHQNMNMIDQLPNLSPLLLHFPFFPNNSILKLWGGADEHWPLDPVGESQDGPEQSFGSLTYLCSMLSEASAKNNEGWRWFSSWRPDAAEELLTYKGHCWDIGSECLLSAGVSPVNFRQNTDTWLLGMVSLIPQGMETEFQEWAVLNGPANRPANGPAGSYTAFCDLTLEDTLYQSLHSHRPTHIKKREHISHLAGEQSTAHCKNSQAEKDKCDTT